MEHVNHINEKNVNRFGSEMIIVNQYKVGDKKSYKIDIYFPKYNYILKYREYGDFKRGVVKCPYDPSVCGVGYIGEGIYSCSNDKKAYSKWVHMLGRCYDLSRQKEQPTYIGCKVCEEWYNFQNFAKWFYENYYEIEGEKIELDKDILYKGNKIYSPETCMFVPKKINNLFSGSLSGVYYDKGACKWRSRIGKNKKYKHLGYFDTYEEAYNIYRIEKQKAIDELINDYFNKIPDKQYEKLRNAISRYEL